MPHFSFNYICAVLLWLLLFSSIGLQGQQTVTPIDLEEILKEKDSLLNEGLLSEALELLQESQKLELLKDSTRVQAELAISIANLEAQIALAAGKSGQTNLERVKATYDSLLRVFENNQEVGSAQIAEVYIAKSRLASQNARDTTQISLLMKALSILGENNPEQLAKKARVYNALGHLKLTLERNYKQATYYFKESLRADSLSNKSDYVLRAENYRGMALTAYYEGLVDETRPLLEKARKQLKKAQAYAPRKRQSSFLTSLLLAAQARRNTQLDSAIYWNKESVRTIEQMQNPPKNLLSQGYNNLSGDFYKKGDYLSALAFADKALEIRKVIYEVNDPRLANTYTQKANAIAAGFGQYDKARVLYEEAYRIAGKNYPSNNPIHLTYITNLIYVYSSLGLHEKSLELGKKGLAIALGPDKTENINAARFYTDLGGSYSYMGNTEASLNNYNQALKIYSRFFGEVHYRVGLVHFEIGETHYSNHDYDQSIYHLNKAKEILESYRQTRDFYYFRILDALARNYLQKDEPELAEKSINTSINSNIKDNTVTANLDSLTINDVLYSQIFTEELVIKGAIEYRKYLKNGDPKHLKISQFYLKKAQSLVNGLLLKGTSQADQINLLDLISPAAALGTLVTAELLQDSATSANFEDLFQFMESSRGTTLKMVGLRNANPAASMIPAELTDLESFFRTEIVKKQGEITSAYLQENKEVQETLEADLFLTRQRRDSLLEVIKANYPRLYSLNFEHANFPLKEIQAQLRDEQMIVLYQKAESSLFALLIEKDGVSLERTILDNSYDSLLINFPKYLQTSDQNSFQAVSRKLSSILLGPIKDQIKGKSLIIAPDGLMWNVHFDLLKMPDKDRYLLEENAVSYAYSVNLLFQAKSPKSRKTKMLAFSFDNGKESESSMNVFRNSSAINLPGTVEEIRNIAALIPGDYLFGSEANESNFKQKAPQSDILHLALHGKVDDNNPDNSRLFFTQSDTDTLEDGYLYPFELYEMTLDAQLAVLSACETGTGKITNGEGIISLGRAFQYAGVNSLLLSQWEVSDASTPVIMTSFYENLKQGMHKDEALRQAKLSFFKNANNLSENPLYWGSFFILGNTDAIDLNSKSLIGRYWLPLLAIVLLMFFGVRAGRKKTV
ncbi:MAG: CHAT domain-containing protein [Roseivirga sp.]|nr:CHAT domain-containing protein [Roseivirga sp.]